MQVAVESPYLNGEVVRLVQGTVPQPGVAAGGLASRGQPPVDEGDRFRDEGFSNIIKWFLIFQTGSEQGFAEADRNSIPRVGSSQPATFVKL